MVLRFLRNEKGSSAVEFAIVAGPFFLILFAAIELSAKTIVQSQLDHQLYDFAMTLSRDDDAGSSMSEYKESVVCGGGGSPVLSCEDILVGASAYRNDVRFFSVRNDVIAGQWNTGCAGSTVVVELLYPVTNILIPFAVADIVEHNGQEYFRSRGVIRREPLLSGTGTLSGGIPC